MKEYIYMNPWSKKIIDKLTPDEYSTLAEIDKYFLSNPGICELPKSLFNTAHSKQKQKINGITYTPARIRKELTRSVIDRLRDKIPLDKVKISDPCCGSGLFSITLLEELEQHEIHPRDSIKNNIFFGDVDPLSVAISLSNIYRYLEHRNIECDDIEPNFFIGDFLNTNHSVDGYITNPPYVKIQNLDADYREKLRNKYPETFSGSLGLSAVFLQHMFDTLSDIGILGVITQNNFFTSNSGKFLRKYIEDHISRIDTFGSEYIFDEVSAYTCLLYLSSSETKEFEYRKICNASDFNSPHTIVSNDKLHHSKWRLGNEIEVDALKKMESIGTPLGKACRIWVGIATQFDKAFTVTKEDDQWFSIGPRGERVAVESGIVRPLIKIADLTTEESLEDNNRGVIYPYVIKGTKVEALSEYVFRDRYPFAYVALKNWYGDLMSRQKGAIKPEDWYKWGRIQSMIPVSGKLLTKTFNKGPCFYFDSSDSLFSNGYALTVADNDFQLDYIRVILNSRFFENYAKMTSFEIKGGYQCYQKNFIERFCIPKISIENQRQVVSGKIDVNQVLFEHFDLFGKIKLDE